MELRHLRYFIAVAEELHFTRAAERLHIGQPPLSQQIQALEAELGVLLFERSRRRVALTEAGQCLLERARALLAELEQIKQETRRVGHGESGELRIAFTNSLPFTTLLPRLIYRFRRRYPDVRLNLRDLNTRLQLEALAAGELDIGFVRGPDFSELPEGLCLHELSRDPLRLVVHVDHPLAKRDRVALIELADEPFVMFSDEAGTGLLGQFRRLCRERHFTPRVAQEARESSTIIGLVAAGLGLSILPAPMECVRVEGVRYLPLSDPDFFTSLTLATREGPRRASVANFVALAESASSNAMTNNQR